MFPKYEYRDSPLFIRLKHKTSDYPARFHKQVEIVCVETGTLKVSIDGSSYTLEEGDLYIVFPNLLHTVTSGEGASISLMIFDSEHFSSFSDTLFHFKPTNPVLKKSCFDPIIHSIFERVHAISVSENSYRLGALIGYLNAILGEIFPLLSLVRRESDNRVIQQLILYFLDHYTEDITLSQAAQALNYNKYYISHVIGETLGCNFRSLINSYRVGMAQNLLLSTNKTVGEITSDCGFKNQSSFNRIFLKYAGMTPSAYRRQQDTAPDKPMLILR
ncbi:MAG: helix-turn-helix transcriptional regulator [Clostridia bacterium]|nr:helix-turn-helix transcriptional regulator [Clostridia bacterium]